MTLTSAQPQMRSALGALRLNWRIYAIDGTLLAIFMVSACVSVIVLEHPSSPVHALIGSGFIRRSLIGLAMAVTAIGLIYSPLGRRSGAFMNPAMTIGFLRMGRLKPVDAIGYIAGQFVGGAGGVLVCAALFRSWLSDPAVNYVVTTPGRFGLIIAWLGEFLIAFLMMTTVMAVNKRPRLAPYTGCFAATLVWLYITFEAPISGMSLNPARTFGSSVVANLWTGWWIYLTAPVAGMLAGIELHRRVTTQHQRLCGKLSHSHRVPCFIRCNCISDSSR